MFKNTHPNRTNLLIDLATFAGFLIAAAPRITGETIHEWFGLALGAALLVHLLLHWKWIVAVTQRFFQQSCRSARLNYVINSLLFVAFTAIIFSGVMMSKSVLPTFGLQAAQSFFWRWLHEQSTNLTLLLLGLHVALHWKWVVDASLRYLFAPIAGLFRPVQPVQPAYQAVKINPKGDEHA